jgi:DNA-binding transcriptional LysR family regulator
VLTDYAAARWIAGCERCREHLLRQCAQAGFTPRIAFTTDDYVAVQALVAAGLGVTTLPGLALRAARHPGVRAEALPGARRRVSAHVYGAPPDPPAVSLLLEVLAEGRPESGSAAGDAAARIIAEH